MYNSRIFDIFKIIAFTFATVVFMVPFMSYSDKTKGFVTRSPNEPLVLVVCFVFSMIFDAFQMRNDILQKKNSTSAPLSKWEKGDIFLINIEILIISIILPLEFLFNQINLKNVSSMIVIICAIGLFALKIVFLVRFLFFYETLGEQHAD